MTRVLVRPHAAHRRQPHARHGARPSCPSWPARPSSPAARCSCSKLEMLPVECVVRGYLVGSGWKDYQRTGTVCGTPLPAGLAAGRAAAASRCSRRPPRPSWASTTRTSPPTQAHRARRRPTRSASCGDASIALYEVAAEHAAARGIILADTKFEFGLDADGELVLADEVLTPDSSRYWPADSYAHRHERRRASTSSTCATTSRRSTGTRRAPGPELPDDVARRHRGALPRRVRAHHRRRLRRLPRTRWE